MKISFAIAGLFVVAACSDDPYAPIVDGPRSAAFQKDLASCRQVAQQKKSTNIGRNGGAILGGLAGAAEADSGEALEGAVVGAVLGGVIGSASENGEVDEARDKIVFNCMRGRGHNVVG
jgi:outer membrane lipoprotein SlyB